MTQITDESLASYSKQALGVPQTLQNRVVCTYTTSSGDSLYEKILVGYKPVLFPTAVSENCCFEYRFTVKDLILPSTLPEITGLYFKDIVVKLQDMFTQTIAGEAICGGKILAYMPYCTLLAQDENGIEVSDYVLGGKSYKVINSNRLVQRESCPVFSVNSNLKMEKSISLQDQSNPYKLIGVFQAFDAEGNPLRKYMEVIKSISPEQLYDIVNETASIVEKRKGKSICIDVILCDMLVFCKRTFDFTKPSIESVDALSKPQKQTVPLGWLSPEERLHKMVEFENAKKGLGNRSETEKLPNDLFYYVDMTAKCNQVMASTKPEDMVFEDDKGLITPFKNQYAYSLQIINTRTYDK